MNDNLQALKVDLEGYSLPPQLQTTTDPFDENQLKTYQRSNTEYLRNKTTNSIVKEALETYQNGSFELPVVPSAEEQAALQERSQTILQSVVNHASLVQRKRLELKAKYEYFLQQKEALNNATYTSDGNDDDDDTLVDEGKVIEQERQLSELQQQKAALQVQLATLQKQNETIVSESEASQSKLQEWSVSHPELGNVNDPIVLQQLQVQNQNLQREADKFTEIRTFYETLQSIVEETSGIKVIKVAPPLTNDNGDDTTSNRLIMSLKLLQKYDLDITLSIEPKDTLVIHSVESTSNSTLLVGPSDPHHDPVQLQIPPLDDYVALSKPYKSGENLRFVLRETLARLKSVQSRVDELSQLQTVDLVKIEKLSGNMFGGQDQEVIVSLNDLQLTLVLRLTPDCPLIQGSASLLQLVGLGGWNNDILQALKEMVQAQLYASPVTIVTAVRDAVRDLQQQRQFEIPGTPRIPGMPPFFSKSP